MVRISKFLAECGFGARRKSEEIVLSGKVMVNGQVIKDLARMIDPESDRVQVRGKFINQIEKGVLLLNKPRGVVSTLSDPQHRRTIVEYLTKHYSNYFPVGRLDYDSSGLVILTNDGDLANMLLHPRYGCERIYEVRVKGSVNVKTLERLKRGVKITEVPYVPKNFKEEPEEVEVKPKKIYKSEEFKNLLPSPVSAPRPPKQRAVRGAAKIVSSDEGNTWLHISVDEGKNRMVRRMFEQVGHPVIKLKRIQHGPIKLGNLSVGQVRKLTFEEYKKLKKSVDSFVKK